MNILTFPRPVFARALERLWRQSTPPLRFAAGINCWEGHTELLVSPAQPTDRNGVEVRLVDTFSALQRLARPDLSAILEVGWGVLRGQASGFVRNSRGNWKPLEQLRLVGSGMHLLPLTSDQGRPRSRNSYSLDSESRTAGALGLPVLQRLRTLQPAVIGVGATGTRVTQSLALLGVEDLVLIDRDVLEPHNLLAVDGISDAAVGQSKVHALADSLIHSHPGLRVTPVEASITSVRRCRRCARATCCSAARIMTARAWPRRCWPRCFTSF